MCCFVRKKNRANDISYHRLETDINFELVIYECVVSGRGLPGFRVETLIQVVPLSQSTKCPFQNNHLNN